MKLEILVLQIIMNGRNIPKNNQESGCMKNNKVKHENKPIPEYYIFEWEKIHLACESGNIDWLKELLANGADKNIKNDEGNTPIISAIFEQEIAVIDFLISQNVFINGETLIKSIQVNNKTIIQKIIIAGANVHYVSKEGWNILIHLIINSDYDLFKWFLDKYRLKINHIDKNGLTPIFHSSGLGYVKMTKKLIELGADINHKNNDGLSLLEWCDEMIENPNVTNIKQMINNVTQQFV